MIFYAIFAYQFSDISNFYMVQPRWPLRRLWTPITWVNKNTRYKLPVHFLLWGWATPKTALASRSWHTKLLTQSSNSFFFFSHRYGPLDFFNSDSQHIFTSEKSIYRI